MGDELMNKLCIEDEDGNPVPVADIESVDISWVNGDEWRERAVLNDGRELSDEVGIDE